MLMYTLHHTQVVGSAPPHKILTHTTFKVCTSEITCGAEIFSREKCKIGAVALGENDKHCSRIQFSRKMMLFAPLSHFSTAPVVPMKGVLFDLLSVRQAQRADKL